MSEPHCTKLYLIVSVFFLFFFSRSFSFLLIYIIVYWIVSSFSEGDIENCHRLFSVLPFFFFSIIVPSAYNIVVVLDSHNRT